MSSVAPAGGPAGDEPAGAPVRIDLTDGRAHVSIHGDLDVGSSSTIVDAVVAAFGGHPLTVLVVDMSGAGFVDSTGLGSLIRLRAEARRRGARTTLIGLDHRLEKLLRLTGLDREFSLG